MAIPVTAITAAISAAAAIMSDPEAMNNVAEIANAATKAINAGAETAGAAAETLSPVAKKVTSAGAEAGEKVKDAAGKAFSGASKRVGKLFDGASDAVKNAQDARAREKALLEARQQVLAGASASLSAADFEKNWSQAIESNGLMPLKIPGYYAIATYKGKPARDGAAKYTGLFMGRSEDMGASIHRHLNGDGNPDVYADMKYGQYVHVYSYADFDDTDDNNETLLGFSLALGANESYNARVLDGFDEGAIKLDAVISQTHMQDVLMVLHKAFADVDVVERELCGDGVMACKISARLGDGAAEA